MPFVFVVLSQFLSFSFPEGIFLLNFFVFETKRKISPVDCSSVLFMLSRRKQNTKKKKKFISSWSICSPWWFPPPPLPISLSLHLLVFLIRPPPPQLLCQWCLPTSYVLIIYIVSFPVFFFRPLLSSFNWLKILEKKVIQICIKKRCKSFVAFSAKKSGENSLFPLS